MPWPVVEAEVVQGTTGFHDAISKVVFAGSYYIFDDAIPLDSSYRMFDSDAQAGNGAVAGFLLGRQFFPAWLLEGLQDGNVRKGKALESSVLTQPAAGRQDQAGLIGDFLVMFGAFAGWGQQQDFGSPIDEHIVLDAMLFLLAAVEKLLQDRILGPGNRSFGAILEEKRPSFDLFQGGTELGNLASRSLPQIPQGFSEPRMQKMDPLIGRRLRHAKNRSEDVLGRTFAQVCQHKHQFVFGTQQGTVAVLHVRPLPAPLCPFQGMALDPLQKALPKDWHQHLEFFMGQSRQRHKRSSFIGISGKEVGAFATIIVHRGVPPQDYWLSLGRIPLFPLHQNSMCDNVFW